MILTFYCFKYVLVLPVWALLDSLLGNRGLNNVIVHIYLNIAGVCLFRKHTQAMLTAPYFTNSLVNNNGPRNSAVLTT